MSLLTTRFKLLNRFVGFFWKANTVYGIHSPFVYEVAKNILEDSRTFYAFPIIEDLRGRLLKSNHRVHISDFGAGSKASKKLVRTVGHITRHGSISPYVGKLLFRLVNHFKPLTILELGTSLGISTMYQSAASLNAKVLTIEGCPETAELAGKNFTRTGMNWIEVVNDQFEIALPEALKALQKIDYVFIDGDHRANATIQYFQDILPHVHNDSLIVVADIYWSDEMMQSWQQLIAHPDVTLSLDFYHFGVLFFRKEQREKSHFKLVPKWWKPWSFLVKK